MIIGGINWGLIGFFNYNLVSGIFGAQLAVTYLNPLSSVGPGSYVVWQNSINSYQLWKKRKNEIKYKL